MQHNEHPSHNDKWRHTKNVPVSDEVMDRGIDRLIRTAGIVCIGSAAVVAGNICSESIAADAIASKMAVASGVLWLIVSGNMKKVLNALDRSPSD